MYQDMSSGGREVRVWNVRRRVYVLLLEGQDSGSEELLGKRLAAGGKLPLEF